MRNRTTLGITLALTALIAVMGVWAFATTGSDTLVSDGNPESRAVDYERALADAPAPLARLYAKGDALLGGGPEAFERRLADLRGYPVVVNLWASWCGPCRFEFPFFQRQAAEHGERVAFIGVDSDDSDAAAREFLDRLPLPYPSYTDPDREIFRVIDASHFPTTVFYDRQGDVAYTHVGPYRDEQQLARDIERYAG